MLEANAKATFIDEYTSEEFGERLFTAGSVEIILGDGANLRYVSLQNWSRTVAQINRIKARLDRNSRLESLTVSLGADAARAEVECVMNGPGSESEMLGLYFRRRQTALQPVHACSTTPPTTRIQRPAL